MKDIPDDLKRDICSGEYLGPLPDDDEDPAYCPVSRSHKHSWISVDNPDGTICEWCGAVEE